MKKTIFFIVISILILPVMAFTAKIIVGTDQGYPPYEYKQGNKITGFNVEIMREIAKLEKLDIEIVAGPWAKIRESFENQEIDALTGFYYYPSRTEYTTFTHPHGYIVYSIFTHSESDIKTKEDLYGKTIIVQEGDVMVDYIEREAIEANVLSYDSPEVVLNTLTEGIGDCALIGQKQGQYLIQQKNIKGIHFLHEPLFTIPYCFAVQKGNRELEFKLNEGLRKLHLSGRYSEIYNKWFGTSGNKILSLIITVLLIIGAVVWAFLILFYTWNTKLKQQVAKKTNTISRAKKIIEKKNTNLKIQNEKLAKREMELRDINKLYKSLFNAMRIIILSKGEEEMNRKLLRMLVDEFELILLFMISVKTDEQGNPIEWYIQESYSFNNTIPKPINKFALKKAWLLSEQKHFQKEKVEAFGKDFCCGEIIKMHQIKEIVTIPIQFSTETKLWCFFTQEEGKFTEKTLHHLKLLSEDYAFAVSLYRARQEIINAHLETESAINLKNEFLANISHELRTPLNGIMGMTQLLKKTQTDDEQNDYINMLSLSSKQLLKVINQLLDYSILEKAHLNLELKPVPVKEFIDEILIPMKQTALSKGLSFSYHIDPKLPSTISLDEDKIRHTLMNLVSNAIKYTNEGLVSVSLDIVLIKEKEYLRFTVEDSGIGIPFSSLNDIFNTFYQIDGSYSREYGGTGLGLSIAKKSIEMHKGWIEVESELGKGSTFRFFIPIE
ncbi:MAG: transporter substrate-binding domain-containing protein [Thermotogota bacterium]